MFGRRCFQTLEMKVRCPLRYGHESFVFYQQIEIGAGYGLGWRVTWPDVVAVVDSVFVALWALTSRLIGSVAGLVVVDGFQVSVESLQE